MTTLSFERAGVARLHLGDVAQARRPAGRAGVAKDALADPVIRDRVASIYSDIACMRWMT